MDDLRRIDLNLLLTLHALLSEKHVTRAATRLHKSQPAVSHALAQLRRLFDDVLLVRHGGSMVLTARAQSLVQPLESALAQLNSLVQAPVFDPSLVTRRFQLALSDYAARLVLPCLVQRLRQQAPGVELAISQGSREAMLAQLLDGEIDLALGVFVQHAARIRTQTLFEEHFVSIADRQTLPANQRLSREAWLARHHVLVALRPDTANEIDRALASQGLSRHVAIVLPHWGAAIDLLAGTDLVLTVASRSLDRSSVHPGLCQFPPPVALPQFAFQQAWHARRDADAAHLWLRNLIAQQSGSNDGR